MKEHSQWSLGWPYIKQKIILTKQDDRMHAGYVQYHVIPATDLLIMNCSIASGDMSSCEHQLLLRYLARTPAYTNNIVNHIKRLINRVFQDIVQYMV